MRAPIIEDTTRTTLIVKDPFGPDEQGAGYYLAEICPVFGTEILPLGPWQTWDEAFAVRESLAMESLT